MRNKAAHNDIRLLLKINYRLFTSVIIEFLFAPQFFAYTETMDDEAKDMEINDPRDRTLRPSEQIITTANVCRHNKKKKKKGNMSQVRLRRSVSSLKASACSRVPPRHLSTYGYSRRALSQSILSTAFPNTSILSE